MAPVQAGSDPWLCRSRPRPRADDDPGSGRPVRAAVSGPVHAERRVPLPRPDVPKSAGVGLLLAYRDAGRDEWLAAVRVRST